MYLYGNAFYNSEFLLLLGMISESYQITVSIDRIGSHWSLEHQIHLCLHMNVAFSIQHKDFLWSS